ncbi:hypothetical protein K3495_g6427 [Podosphaera aphanis]|nr:hypothetical protein K3495_g6427 [Podosphaera aphanis]
MALAATFIPSDLHLRVDISPSVEAFYQPIQTFLANNQRPAYDSICAGAFIFDRLGRLLIVQRAASDSYPGCWEIPGGSCEATDPTILDGLAREVFEETGLQITAIRQVMDRDGRMILSRLGKRILKLEFEIEVQSTDTVKLDPSDHQAYMWSTEEECRTERHNIGIGVLFKFTSTDQLASVLNAFQKKTGNQA